MWSSLVLLTMMTVTSLRSLVHNATKQRLQNVVLYIYMSYDVCLKHQLNRTSVTVLSTYVHLNSKYSNDQLHLTWSCFQMQSSPSLSEKVSFPCKYHASFPSLHATLSGFIVYHRSVVRVLYVSSRQIPVCTHEAKTCDYNTPFLVLSNNLATVTIILTV
jgi:hypothetical protein